MNRTIPHKDPSPNDPSTILADRRKAAREQQDNATPPIVPLADPATTMREVPPGIAPVRAVPARKPGDGGSATMAPKDSVGEEKIDPKNPVMVEGEARAEEPTAEEKKADGDEKRADLRENA